MPTPTTIGQHILLAGDLTAGGVVALMGDEKADVVYVDPPWGPGMLSQFATMAGTRPSRDWFGFLTELASAIAAARRPEAPVFVEMGRRWTGDLDETMANAGLCFRRRWETTYGNPGRPMPATVALYGPVDVPVTLPDPPHGGAVTRALLGAVVRPGLIVLDPCTGLGTTARATYSLGGFFRGLELNEERLAKTELWLRRQCR